MNHKERTFLLRNLKFGWIQIWRQFYRSIKTILLES